MIYAFNVQINSVAVCKLHQPTVEIILIAWIIRVFVRKLHKQDFAEAVDAIVQDGKLKHLTYYDANHKQHISVDLLHPHGGVKPHIHVDLNHDPNSPGIPPADAQKALIKKIKKEFHLL